jgi:hypothetical protein
MPDAEMWSREGHEVEGRRTTLELNPGIGNATVVGSVREPTIEKSIKYRLRRLGDAGPLQDWM